MSEETTKQEKDVKDVKDEVANAAEAEATVDNQVEEEVVAEAKETAEEAAPQAEEAAPVEPEVIDFEKKALELEDKNLRLRAEFDNYRKRMAREFGEVRDQARRTTVTDFLTVYDYFAMGMASIDTAPNLEILKQGMTMIWAEFQKVLDGLGVKVVDSLGKPFDANIHEAVSQESSDTVAEGIVLREWKKAFMIGDKLLRPAVVVVSSGPEKAVEVAEAAEPVEAAGEGAEPSETAIAEDGKEG